jgi:uncharacterized membrane protein YqhA
MGVIEKIFENTLWSGRLFILLAVVFGMVGAVVLFIVASFDLWDMANYVLNTYLTHAHPDKFHEEVVGMIVGAVDLYLIAVVMLIFSFGLYELFISELDPAKSRSSRILEVHSLDDLKDKLAKVIVMVLIVSFFKRVLHTEYHGALEMLYFSGSIFALSFALYFLHKGHNHDNNEKGNH